eukprot:jgi/Chrzof1/8228/Cz03g02080.t1
MPWQDIFGLHSDKPATPSQTAKASEPSQPHRSFPYLPVDERAAYQSNHHYPRSSNPDEQYQHKHGSLYPPIPSPAEPSAPPYSDAVYYGHQHAHHAPPELPPGQAMVSVPTIEAQPWAINLWKTLARTTVGIARVDLRRPTFPWPEQYDQNSILFKRQAAPRRGRGRPPTRGAAAQQHVTNYYGTNDNHNLNPFHTPIAVGEPDQQEGVLRQPTGARLKITRCFQFNRPEDKTPLLDIGAGVGVDLDSQSLHGIVRLKLKDFLSLSLAPRPMIKLGHRWGVPGTGLAVRFRYECPLNYLTEFWQPPARLMLRLESDVGTGIHLSPTGIEIEERRLGLGNRAEIRAGATLHFPRQLPIDRDDREAFRLQVHRLGLKTQW